MTAIPNSFQNPNEYVDIAMELLTGEEYKCLSFAVRHIYGWQDKISDRKSRISLTMFEKGFTTKDGRRYAGTGLSRGAIIKAVSALVEYGFLGEGSSNSSGTEYEILAEANWELLKERQRQKKDKNRLRTEHGRTGQSDRPMVSGTDQWSVGQTATGECDRLNQIQVQTQVLKDSAPEKGAGAAPKKERKKRTPDPMFDTVQLHIFGSDDPYATGGRIAKISNWLKGKYEGKGSTKLGFISAPAQPKHVKMFADWCHEEGFTPPMDFESFVNNWRKWVTSIRGGRAEAVDKDSQFGENGFNAADYDALQKAKAKARREEQELARSGVKHVEG